MLSHNYSCLHVFTNNKKDNQSGLQNILASHRTNNVRAHFKYWDVKTHGPAEWEHDGLTSNAQEIEDLTLVIMFY